MATTPNGRQNGYVSHPSHRFDDLAFRRPPAPGGRERSGRRFVLLTALGVAVLWGGLYVMFHQWRSQYLVRAAFGTRQVAPVIDAMATLDPPGIARDDWEDAVKRTHALIVTVTDSNLLSVDQMKDLRAELLQDVDRALAHPDTALAELAHVWDSLTDRAAFVLRDTRAADGRRHIRPAIFPTQAKQP
ncbi:MAG: hypothetical protein P4L85_29115 [Paludisphaera borealis]|uniref:hypothetical protein n=1 Tax=Paludisphaera borealis TaxID=1387353 RepID=UPI00284FDC4F|nr:hypothetical protein [Paludisphaera borealis]MDR3623429.1 hypothetical protein [Paludisphaera borealis]